MLVVRYIYIYDCAPSPQNTHAPNKFINERKRKLCMSSVNFVFIFKKKIIKLCQKHREWLKLKE